MRRLCCGDGVGVSGKMSLFPEGRGVYGLFCIPGRRIGRLEGVGREGRDGGGEGGSGSLGDGGW
jgi:hypothetical protein